MIYVRHQYENVRIIAQHRQYANNIFFSAILKCKKIIISIFPFLHLVPAKIVKVNGKILPNIQETFDFLFSSRWRARWYDIF